jgi:hypothetical protein
VVSYSVRPPLRAQLTPERIAEVCGPLFEDTRRDGDAVLARYGAIESLRMWPERRELHVELVMNPKVDTAVAAETIRRYNLVLAELTGYTAKERAAKAQKAAKAARAAG